MKTIKRSIGSGTLVLFTALIIAVVSSSAQTTAFTYQGRLTDNNQAANGNYDFRFQLYNTALNFPTGDPVFVSGVQVVNGSFTVNLDFSSSVQFQQTANNKLSLEIAVRPAGSGGAYTPLAPRQPLNAAPFSFAALSAVSSTNAINAQYAGTANFASVAQNANNFGGMPVGNFIQTNDFRLINDRNPLAGSDNYIQNSIAAQAGVNFNIGGSGTIGGILSAGAVNAATQFNISGVRVLSIAGTENIFAGAGAGNTGNYNAFFGNLAGAGTTNGSANSFFGGSAGKNTANGNQNTFAGFSAGFTNNSGDNNTFVGYRTGYSNTNGNDNTFIGVSAGSSNSTGSRNTYVGYETGLGNPTGDRNTLLGAGAILGANNLTYATAIGAGAKVTSSNQIVLGREGNDQFETGPDSVVIPGRLTIRGDELRIGSVQFAVSSSLPNLQIGGNVRAASLGVTSLQPEGVAPVCIDTSLYLAVCSSSLRYKKDVENFTSGLSLIQRLRPVTFSWKSNNQRDLGFIAEEVNAVEPLMTTYNKDGQIEGVKYDRISAALVNAVNEQQDEIGSQKEIIKSQQRQIDELKRIVCALKPDAAICQQQEEK